MEGGWFSTCCSHFNTAHISLKMLQQGLPSSRFALREARITSRSHAAPQGRRGGRGGIGADSRGA
eukprot:3614511-Pyramimonas_sp.AAC.1